MSAPCPFCRSRNTTASEVSPQIFAVCCYGCGAVGPISSSAGVADRAWGQASGAVHGRKNQVRRTAETRSRASAILRHARAIAALYDDGGGQ